MKNIKEMIINNQKALIYGLLGVFLMFTYTLYKNNEINSLNERINEKSDEEILIEEISHFKSQMDNKKSTIEVLKANIKILEDEIRNYDEPFYNCYKTQLLRRTDNLKYDMKYCNNENINKFKGL